MVKVYFLQISNSDHLFDDFIVGILIVAIIAAYFFLKPKKGYTPTVSFSFPFKRRRYAKILRRYFPFYNRLSNREKRRFLRRIAYFISIKNFVAKDFSKVSQEMKVLVSACAIELTYGLPEIYLSHFKDVHVYSGQKPVDDNVPFDSHETDGKIILNWKFFLKGYIHPSGSYNYGLHEMAKALHFENRIKNDEFCFMKEDDLNEWTITAGDVLKKVKAKGSKFFEQFSGDLQNEFFAVAVESFFERPIEFHDLYPELFRQTSKILNQNPLKLYETASVSAI